MRRAVRGSRHNEKAISEIKKAYKKVNRKSVKNYPIHTLTTTYPIFTSCLYVKYSRKPVYQAQNCLGGAGG